MIRRFLASFFAAWRTERVYKKFLPMDGKSPAHFVVIVPMAKTLPYDRKLPKFEGVDFPLYYGIISVYPRQNKFVFTKKTSLSSFSLLEEELRAFERENCIPVDIKHLTHEETVLVPAKDPDFSYALAQWAENSMVALFKVSGGEEIPVNVVPRFRQTHRYAFGKKFSTDDMIFLEDVEELYIPFTEEEMRRIAKDGSGNAGAGKAADVPPCREAPRTATGEESGMVRQFATPQTARVSRKPVPMDGNSPVHFAVVLPMCAALPHSRDFPELEGTEFPLYYGIISVYPELNRFVFTKKTSLPFPRQEEGLRTIEREECIRVVTEQLTCKETIRVPVDDPEFSYALTWWAEKALAVLFKISGGEEIPVNVVPRFTRTRPFIFENNILSDRGAFYPDDMEELYIPFTAEEMKQIAKDHAR